MSIGLDKAFSTHEQALELRGQRHELLASNIANADTPNYKARDMDFRAAMREATNPPEQPLQATDPMHLQPTANVSASDPKSLYRQPHGASLDGNTVETHVENAKFAENAINYQATLEFMSSRVKKLSGALKRG